MLIYPAQSAEPTSLHSLQVHNPIHNWHTLDGVLTGCPIWYLFSVKTLEGRARGRPIMTFSCMSSTLYITIKEWTLKIYCFVFSICIYIWVLQCVPSKQSTYRWKASNMVWPFTDLHPTVSMYLCSSTPSNVFNILSQQPSSEMWNFVLTLQDNSQFGETVV